VHALTKGGMQARRHVFGSLVLGAEDEVHARQRDHALGQMPGGLEQLGETRPALRLAPNQAPLQRRRAGLEADEHLLVGARGHEQSFAVGVVLDGRCNEDQVVTGSR